MPSDRQHISGLTGLRALAAFWVIVYHLSIAIPFEGTIPAIVQSGFYGVEIFFLISGFVLAASYQSITTITVYKEFLIKRLRRIYPLHIAILVFLAVIIIAAPYFNIAINEPSQYAWVDFIYHATLISAWRFPAYAAWNHYDWAISALFLCYVLFPLFQRIIVRLSASMGLLVCLALFCVTPWVAFVWVYPSAIAYAIPRAMTGFIIGMILFKFYNSPSPKNIRIVLAVIALFLIALGCIIDARFSTLALLAFVLFEIIRRPQWGKKIDNRFLSYWGERSYSLYMVQFPIIMISKKLFFDRMHIDDATTYVMINCVVLSVLLIAAWCAYECIEKRFSSR